MTEEVKNEDIGSTEQIVPKEPSPVEQRAMSEGWVPQEEWQGEPDDWRPAKEFVDRGELFKKIEDQSRTIKQFKATLDAMGKHHAQVRDVEYKRALDTLKSQKKEALVEGDADAVVDIDEKIALVREEQKELSQVPAVADVPQSNPVLDNWTGKNSWYGNDKAMTAYADALGVEFHGKGKSLSDALSEIDRRVKEEFPHKFRNPNKDKPGMVEGSSSRSGSKSSDSFELNEEERQVMHKLVKSGVLTKEEYIKDLRAIKGV